VAHLSVKRAHLRKRAKVVVVSTTSSSENEAVEIKAETSTDRPMVAIREIHSPVRRPSPPLVVSSSPGPPQLSASQANLAIAEVEADVHREDTFMRVLTFPATSPTPSATYMGAARLTPHASPRSQSLELLATDLASKRLT